MADLMEAIVQEISQKMRDGNEAAARHALHRLVYRLSHEAKNAINLFALEAYLLETSLAKLETALGKADVAAAKKELSELKQVPERLNQAHEEARKLFQ